MRYAELHCKTNFSFLEGASFADELIERAVELGLHALAVTDRNSLAGVVRAHTAAKERKLKLLIGAEIATTDSPPILLYAPNRAAYGRLSRLITVGRRRAEKGACKLTLDDVLAHSQGLIAVSCSNGWPTPAGWVPQAQEFPPNARELPAICKPSVMPESSVDRERREGILVAIATHPSKLGWVTHLQRLREAFGERLSLAIELHRGQNDTARREQLCALSRETGIPLVAANDVHYHAAERRFLQDVLVCIREGCSVQTAGRRLFPNGERRLKSAAEMVDVLRPDSEAWLERSVEIADSCSFSLDELRYEYPEELSPAGLSGMDYLRERTWSGARNFWPEGVPEKVRAQLEHELALIEELHYEAYFLTVYDLVVFARARAILCQGRGSAANSAVCFCLGITSVNPVHSNLLFERFISRERGEVPDIDVDFEHERREEVMQYIFEKYGRERAGIVAAVTTYRPKSAARDVGKALGFSLDLVAKLAENMDRFDDAKTFNQRIRDLNIDASERPMRQFMHLTKEILGFPRHLSQHSGGVVMTRGLLSELVPIENASMEGRTVIEWDKNDIDALGILKVDCLSLGMLTCIRKCFDLIRTHLGRDLTLATVPIDDPDVYEMCCHADTIGVFQIESRAQMAMLPRLKPRCFYDLVVEVSIVRPGPIQGGMVHPYLRRRAGEEAVTFPSEALREVLGKTLGVPLFQEQVMRVAVVAAGFTPGEADQLRRAMGAWRRTGLIEKYHQRFISGMLKNGYDAAFATSVFEQIKGFGEYGFPESHAASFALLVYASAWLKFHYPAAFTTALLNSLPMGFYGPAQLIRDAQNHGVTVLPVDVNFSEWDNTLVENWDGWPTPPGWVPQAQEIPPNAHEFPVSRESSESSESTVDRERREGILVASRPSPRGWATHSKKPAIRLGFRQVKGLSYEQHVLPLLRARTSPFKTFEDLARRTGLTQSGLSILAGADAFRSLDMDRRNALWEVLAQHEELPLFQGLDVEEESSDLPTMQLREHVAADYNNTGLSLKAHPVSFVREALDNARALPCAKLRETPDGAFVRVAGIVLVRQRPDTAAGVIFITLEDETGQANAIVWPAIFERFRRAARTAAGLIIEGKLQRQGEIIHVVAQRITDLSELMPALPKQSRDFH